MKDGWRPADFCCIAKFLVTAASFRTFLKLMKQLKHQSPALIPSGFATGTAFCALNYGDMNRNRLTL